MTKPGNVVGSKAIYYKKINSNGKTIEMFKDTLITVESLYIENSSKRIKM